MGYPTLIGELSVVKIMDYYDRPLSFIARDQLGSKYLGYLIDARDNYETFLFTPMTKGRIEELLEGKIAIRDALVFSENGWALESKYVVRSSGLDNFFTTRVSADLSDDELPDADVCFDKEYFYDNGEDEE